MIHDNSMHTLDTICCSKIKIDLKLGFFVVNSEDYPVSNIFKVLEGFDILRTDNLIVAVVAVESNKGRDVRLYRWQKRGEDWKVDLCRMSIAK